MTFMDGLIILASDGRPLITSRFTSSSSSSSAARAQYARIHIDRYNQDILRALDSAAYQRLVHSGPLVDAQGRFQGRKGRSGAGSSKSGSAADNWWGSVALQEAFKGQKINNPALEGPDPLGRDDDGAEEDVWTYVPEQGLIANLRIPATDFEVPGYRSTNDVSPILHAAGIPALSAAEWKTDDIVEIEEEDDAGHEAKTSPVDLLAPTPAPVGDAENVWNQGKDEEKQAIPREDKVEGVDKPAKEADESTSLDWTEPAKERGTALFHKQHNDLHFLIPVSNEVSPLLPLSFLSLFIRTLTLYVGGPQYLNEESVRDNFDLIYQLIEEMLDDGGSWPLTTDANLLMNIVPPERGWRARAEAWAEKLGASLSAQQAPSAVAITNAAINSPVPWRVPTLKYSSNEIYVDVVETLEGTISRDGVLCRANLYGTVICRTKMTGMPDILLSLSKAEKLQSPAFHPCVRSRRWRKEKVLSFIPPDGSCELATFRIGTPHKVDLFEPIADKPMPPVMPSPAAGLESSLPLACHASMHSGPLDPEGRMRCINFEVELDLSRVPSDKTVQDIIVSFELPEDATKVDAAVTAERGSMNASLTSLSSSDAIPSSSGSVQQDANAAGTFLYDAATHVFRWSVPKARPASASILRVKGSYETYDISPRPASNVSLQLQIPMHAVSGVKVDSLLVQAQGIQGEQYKTFKGVRNVFVADLEIRWQ